MFGLRLSESWGTIYFGQICQNAGAKTSNFSLPCMAFHRANPSARYNETLLEQLAMTKVH